MSALATATEKTFANAVKETNTHDSQKSLRGIIKEARTEKFKEDRDKKTRRTNIIIHGVADRNFPDKKEEQKWNDGFAENLFKEERCKSEKIREKKGKKENW